jgi:anti-sigma factor RsiW
MTDRDHGFYDEAVGPYLLGALPPLEAEVFERHLLRCHDCHEELERLRPSVEVLARAVPQVDPPPALREGLMRAVRAEAVHAPRRAGASRGTRRWLVPAAGMAAAVLAFAGYGVTQLGHGPGHRTLTAVVDRNRLAHDSRATLEVLDEGRAAILRVGHLPDPGPGRVYQVWLARGGRIVPGATFTVDRGGSGAAGIPDGVRDARAVMVTRERAGGADAPSEAPVLTVPV